jgi:hypothetical protein
MIVFKILGSAAKEMYKDFSVDPVWNLFTAGVYLMVFMFWGIPLLLINPIDHPWTNIPYIIVAVLVGLISRWTYKNDDDLYLGIVGGGLSLGVLLFFGMLIYADVVRVTTS